MGGLVSGIFKKPKVPRPVAAPVAPSIDDARENVESARRRRLRRGRASTDLVSSESGVATAARQLTGN